ARVALRNVIDHQLGGDAFHRIRTGGSAVVLELRSAERLEGLLDRGCVGPEGDGILRRLGREVVRLRLLGDDPIRQGVVASMDLVCDIRAVVADLPDIQTVQLGLGQFQNDLIDRPRVVLALLDVEPEDPFRPAATLALEGLLAGQVVASLREAASPAMQPDGPAHPDLATERHLDALGQDQRAVSEEPDPHSPSSRLGWGSGPAVRRSGPFDRPLDGWIGGSGSARIWAAASWLQSRSRAGQSAHRARWGRLVTAKTPVERRCNTASIRERAASRSATSKVSRTGPSGRSRKT